MTVMILLIEVIIYRVAIERQLEDSGQMYSELVKTLGKSFDDMHLSFKRGLDFISMNEELQKALKQAESDYGTQGSQEELNGRLKVLLTERALMVNEIRAVYLYDARGQFRTMWKKKRDMGKDYLPFLEIREEWFHPLGSVQGQVIDEKLVFSRKIRSMENLSTLGYLLVVYDEELLYQRIRSVLPNEACFLIVFDEAGAVIAHNYPEKPLLQKTLSELENLSVSGYQTKTFSDHSKWMISCYGSETTGWQIFSLADVDYSLRGSLLLRDMVWILGLVSILAGVAIQYMIARRIVKPIKYMVEVMESAQKGDYSRRMEIRTHDELEILGNAFNHMLKQTDVLVNQVLRGEIKFKETQMALLQAQINPHMLYNMLECINWLAEFNRKEEIRQVTVAFSNLMKSLVSDSRTVTIEKEIWYVENFLSIYRIILQGKLQYEIQVDPDLKDTMIPRLLIQPLVENSVIHGIKKSIFGGSIHVRAGKCEEGFLISVIDDGIGMGQEQVEEICSYAKGCRHMDSKNETGEKRERVGLGVKNVIERLVFTYGERAEFHITSEKDWGTTVDILIRENEEEDMECLIQF